MANPPTRRRRAHDPVSDDAPPGGAVLYKGLAYAITGTLTGGAGTRECCVQGQVQFVPFFTASASFTNATAIAAELAANPEIPFVSPGASLRVAHTSNSASRAACSTPLKLPHPPPPPLARMQA